jgi:hypothetical protein
MPELDVELIVMVVPLVNTVVEPEPTIVTVPVALLTLETRLVLDARKSDAGWFAAEPRFKVDDVKPIVVTFGDEVVSVSSPDVLTVSVAFVNPFKVVSAEVR